MPAYLVTVILNPSSTAQRIGRDVPLILGAVHRSANAEPLLAYRSNDGCMFGLLVASDLESGPIYGALDNCTATTKSDRVIVSELGRDFTLSPYLGRLTAWMQKHLERSD